MKRSFSSNEFKKPKPDGGGAPKMTGDNTCNSSSVAGTTLKLVPPFGQYDGVNATVTIADADFMAGNIKNAVDIFGVTGSLLSPIPFTAGDDLFSSIDPSSMYQSDSYVKRREIQVLFAGTIRVSFDLTNGAAGSGSTYGKIYKNGVAIGTERIKTYPDATWTTYTQDFTVAANDYIQLYTYDVTLGQPGVGNFRLYYNSLKSSFATPTTPTN